MPQHQMRTTLLGGLGVLCLVAISILFLDQGAAHLLTPEQAARSYRVTRTLTDAGESGHFFAIAILGSLFPWLYLKFQKQIAPTLKIKLEKFRFWSVTFLLALIGSGIVTHIGKFLAGRARPNRSEDHFPWQFEFFNSHWHFQSFPSGHSQTLFTAAVAFAFAFPKYAKGIYATAALLAVTRVLLNQHFLSDVIMGSYIGYSVSLFIFLHRFSSRVSEI